jgi:hypothetical protein
VLVIYTRLRYRVRVDDSFVMVLSSFVEKKFYYSVNYILVAYSHCILFSYLVCKVV